MKKLSIQTGQTGRLLSAVAILTVVLALFWTGENNIKERVITVRYFLFALTALVAFITPYIFFPDKNVSILQLGNLSPADFRKYLLKKTGRLFWPVYLFLFVLFFGDLQNPVADLFRKFIFTLGSFLLVSGILLLAITRYLISGESSQFWKESEKGRALRSNLAEYFKYPIDPGSIPSLLNTILVFSAGSITLVLGAILQQHTNIFIELILYFTVFGSGLIMFIKHGESIVRSFYSADAFFHEFFGVSLKGEELRIEREVDQLWWVPSRLKMHVWQFLLQLDRKIPAGRAVAAGHLAVWFIAYQRPEPQFLTIIWLLFAISHQLFTMLSIQQDLAPYWLLRWIDKSYIWTFSRFWMQLRWILPLLLSMNVQYFIFGVPDFVDQSIIIAVYLISAMMSSLFGTYKLKQDLKT